MYTQIGLPGIGLDKLLALVKEAYEASPCGFIKIVLSTGDYSKGGYVSYEYNKDVPLREDRLTKHYGSYSYSQPQNPNLYAAYKSDDFKELCHKHGIEAIVDVPM